MTLLQIEDLETHFSTPGGVVRAVDGVSIEVHPGETIGLVGESGCGKSVTSLSVMDLVPQPAGRVVGGRILFEGRDLTELSPAQMRKVRGNDLAMVFQDPMTSLNPVLTVGRQLTEVMRLHLGYDRAAARKRGIELLELVGIPRAPERMDEFPHQFSGGMRQRVMLAIALACEPKLILADEITTALDVTIQAQILGLLRELVREVSTAFVLITHDLGVVAGMTDRVYVMYAGQIVEAAPTDQLYANPRMPYTWGLLNSIPRLDAPIGQKLFPIEGSPPDLLNPPQGCRFEPRCQYRRDICSEQPPELVDAPGVQRSHQIRCWGTQDVDGGGWLLDVDAQTAVPEVSLAAPKGGGDELPGNDGMNHA